jgi:ribosomal protein S18 acetylase RimI-like enzyme
MAGGFHNRWVMITFEWRGEFENAAVSALHAEGFGAGRGGVDWHGQVHQHSLGWVCARQGGDLAGFVNVAWDGGAHAFILDTVVAVGARRCGIGSGLVAAAAGHARAAGCEWLHVDFEDHLAAFYFRACGFTPTSAGLISLAGEPSGNEHRYADDHGL